MKTLSFLKNKEGSSITAFEDAVKNGDNHNASKINYRQVWARTDFIDIVKIGSVSPKQCL